MSNQRCPRCGFAAGDGDTVCRQCGVGLTASPYVDAMLNDAPRWNVAQPQGMQAPQYGAAYGPRDAASKDLDHLNILSIFHFVVGGLMGIAACIPVVYFVIGIVFIAAGTHPGDSQDGPPAFLGWIFVLVATLLIAAGWTLAGCVISAGRNLRRHERHTFCMVVAALMCLWMPFGTVLGIFTIVTLQKQSVKELFQRSSSR